MPDVSLRGVCMLKEVGSMEEKRALNKVLN